MRYTHDVARQHLQRLRQAFEFADHVRDPPLGVVLQVLQSLPASRVADCDRLLDHAAGNVLQLCDVVIERRIERLEVLRIEVAAVSDEAVRQVQQILLRKSRIETESVLYDVRFVECEAVRGLVETEEFQPAAFVLHHSVAGEQHRREKLPERRPLRKPCVAFEAFDLLIFRI